MPLCDDNVENPNNQNNYLCYLQNLEKKHGKKPNSLIIMMVSWYHAHCCLALPQSTYFFPS
jgi:hypothetical protein